MSDNAIVLIPEKAGYVPPSMNQQLAEAKLRQLAPQADEVSVVVNDMVQFEHCGENFEAIFCPACGKEVEMEWWQERMDEDYGADKGFKLGSMTMTCCGATSTLHDLRYQGPQGFARFSLTAMNPNIGEMSPDMLSGVEAAIGCKLRIIYRHI